MRDNKPSKGGRAYLGGSLVLILASTAQAQSLTNPLTLDQVSCDEFQLERLEKRFVVIEEDPAAPGFARNPSLFLWRSSSAGGVYSGLAVTGGIGLLGNEEQLAFDLFARQFGERLNPRRPLIPQATLARRSQDSNLVAPGAAPALIVSLDLVGQPVTDPYVPTVPLVVNSLSLPGRGEQPLPAADSVGRGIGVDGLAESCHGQFTPFDNKIFGIISRSLRNSECTPKSGCHPDDDTAYNVTVLRGADPQTYRANVYLYSKTCPNVGPCEYSQYAKVALEFTMTWDQNGSLGMGQVRVLPLCTGGQTSGCSNYEIARIAMYLLPPLFAGHEQQGQDVIGAAARLVVEFPASPDNTLSATVNWRDLLANSAWN
ncbi:MAG TPA: hypothetical protein VHQ90_25270 [Thermoanaerobaculia bacterium]|nr:hypothetical protein [Thermoanaerobaculia bacterium]